MILPCEVAVKSVVPAIRALMAKELVEEHGLRQDQVAEILGVSQSAVSKYSRKVRGYAVKVDDIGEVQPLINEMVILLRNRGYKRAEFLKLFCRACLTIRNTNLMCKFCGRSDPKIKIEECGFCTDASEKMK